MAAEGISLSPYIGNGLHREPWTEHILTLDVYKKMYAAERLKKFKKRAVLAQLRQGL